MKISVNLCDLALLLDLPEGMSIESASSDDMVLVCDVEAPDFEDGNYFAQYDVDDNGLVGLADLTPQ